jgi:hypothetical protein
MHMGLFHGANGRERSYHCMATTIHSPHDQEMSIVAA